MKRKYKPKNYISKKSVILAAVSLLLALVTTIGVTASWIEEVSQVDFSSTDGQETPLHIKSELLKSDAEIKQQENQESIPLDKYFYESGDMHLSPCYGDGQNFYFPIEGGGYRTGTKDDANVNYLSATFNIESFDASTAYWFEKSGNDHDTPYVTFKNGTELSDTTDAGTVALMSKLRFSITVDGATSVYSLDEDSQSHKGIYKTVVNNAVSAEECRRVDQYTYYTESFSDNNALDYYKNSANVTGKPNQGEGQNLNGNTLFNVNKYDSGNKATAKTVIVKMWLEYDSNYPTNDDVNIASINMNLVSSWAKERRIYVKDCTVSQYGRTQAKWLSHDGTNDNSAKLYFGIKGRLDDENCVWQLTRVNTTSDYYYINVPAIYNNADVVLFRCPPAGWDNGNTSYSDGTTTVSCWDYWETAFPDTFHSETYSVYTNVFGTWESVARHVEIINSCKFNNSPYNNENQFTEPYAYMWDSSTDIPGQSDRVVQNASWPGKSMTLLNDTKSNLNIYSFYYDSIFDRIIFNDDYNPASAAYQTEDINLDQAKTNPQYYDGKIYDMATMKWYNDRNSLPTYSGYSVYGDFYNSNDKHRYTVSRMVVNPNDSNEVYCRVYVRYANSNNQYYFFKVMKNDKSEYLGYGVDNTYWVVNDNMDVGNQPKLAAKYNNKDTNDIRLHATNASGSTHPGIYGIYFNTSTNKLWVQRES